jgi:tRNA(Ile)-lysidine synthase
MRKTILPELSKQFGKDVHKGLHYLGSEAGELRTYFEAHLVSYLKNIVRGPWGWLLDLSSACPQFSIEIKYLLRFVFEAEKIFFSRETVDVMVALIQSGGSNRQFPSGKHALYIDRKRVFFIFSQENLVVQPLPLNSVNSYGSWIVSASTYSSCADSLRSSSWKEAWQGLCQISLPLDRYSIGFPSASGLYRGNSSISKWWSDHKIPAFLRGKVPVIWREGRIEHEFLTGKSLKQLNVKDARIDIVLKYDGSQSKNC